MKRSEAIRFLNGVDAIRRGSGERWELEDWQRRLICRAYDVPPWVVGISPRPRFPRLRWALRRWWPV